MSAATIAERVAAGALWLDKNRPGWIDRIDLDRLRMRSCAACILGQEYGDYYRAPVTADKAVWLGFDAYHDGDGADREFAELDTAWFDLIEARRDAEVPA